ncbi:hypothetical protein VMCG_01011 [Cytospora schulzeri]|uniref:Uncharacterized protein n=1 Tax=Cytospora schulzeri TaxID=448051 RepID=A0A423X4J5_9PEZI|nr:hypothetical protein VMCG_01011 [Valsa malicola]
MAKTATHHKSIAELVYRLAEAVELVLTTLCSFATSEHVFHMERMVANGKRTICPPFIHFDLHLSPGQVLASCLIFGVSVSSFVYRRQDKDPAQAVVFLVVVLVVIALGFGSGASMNIILLGWLPWAADVAMVISVWNHYLSRGGMERQGVDEKNGRPD